MCDLFVVVAFGEIVYPSLYPFKVEIGFHAVRTEFEFVVIKSTRTKENNLIKLLEVKVFFGNELGYEMSLPRTRRADNQISKVSMQDVFISDSVTLRLSFLRRLYNRVVIITSSTF